MILLDKHMRWRAAIMSWFNWRSRSDIDTCTVTPGRPVKFLLTHEIQRITGTVHVLPVFTGTESPAFRTSGKYLNPVPYDVRGVTQLLKDGLLSQDTLSEIVLGTENKTYYVSRGIILDGDMRPLLLATWDMLDMDDMTLPMNPVIRMDMDLLCNDKIWKKHLTVTLPEVLGICTGSVRYSSHLFQQRVAVIYQDLGCFIQDIPAPGDYEDRSGEINRVIPEPAECLY